MDIVYGVCKFITREGSVFMKKICTSLLAFCIASLLGVGFVGQIDVEAAKAISIKEKYVTDIGQNFKYLSKKYSWNKDNFECYLGIYETIDENGIVYAFSDSMNLNDDSICIEIGQSTVTSLSDIMVGMKKDMSAGKFAKRLSMSYKNVTHEKAMADAMSGHNEFLEGEDGCYEKFHFETIDGKKLQLAIDLPGKSSRLIKKDAFFSIF